MTDRRNDLRREIERLGGSAEAEMKALGERFRADVEKAIASPRKEEIGRKVEQLAAEFERKLAAMAREIEARLQKRFGRAPAAPPRRPYVERFSPRGPLPRRGNRPSAGGVTVDPNRPKGLSGGAAAPLEFDPK